MPDFEKIEKYFSRILAASGTVLSDSELAEVGEFVNVGEYGIALDIIVAIFVEEGKKAPADVILLIEQLATAMMKDPALYADRLGKRKP